MNYKQMKDIIMKLINLNFIQHYQQKHLDCDFMHKHSIAMQPFIYIYQYLFKPLLNVNYYYFVYYNYLNSLNLKNDLQRLYQYLIMSQRVTNSQFQNVYHLIRILIFFLHKQLHNYYLNNFQCIQNINYSSKNISISNILRLKQHNIIMLH